MHDWKRMWFEKEPNLNQKEQNQILLHYFLTVWGSMLFMDIIAKE